ncbi:hypothetical protein OMCYN_01406 [cyanobiont of Ornithocercus magnificus]|nr:hypothetical protein OMCYN_01406 [cyanobiont of Ornithocercus magnificus]
MRVKRLLPYLLSCLILLSSIIPAALAVAPQDFPTTLPTDHVIDGAEVLSRAVRSELEARLQDLERDRIDARLITLKRLDYGLTLTDFGDKLLKRWAITDQSLVADKQLPLLLLLIESQNKRADIVAASILEDQLPEALLKSTARTTMSQPLRNGDRYRQASLEAIQRLKIVLDGGEDPGPPVELTREAVPTNIPTVEQTRESNAFTWVIVLLVIGTIVPMATWWVFSR